MKLGILVNTDRHLAEVAGLTHAALAKGHEVAIFTMDEGTRLLADPGYIGLHRLPGVSMSVCQHSAETLNMSVAGLPPEIHCGSQLQNAMMQHAADRVVVL
ncbi:MAG: DsrE family protein [Gammaproteobacteria bacterium]|nr:DsrE family protein [Gammaproteobacteria bacterium]